MTLESLMQVCAGLGIRVTLAGDRQDRLHVDAPKGTLTQSIREELAAHKLDLVVALKAKSRAGTQASATDSMNSSEDSVTCVPPAQRVISDQQLASLPANFEGADAQVNNLLAGRNYNVAVVEGSDAASRQVITAKLLAAITGQNTEQQERARQAFLNHGYFDDATRDLRTADSPTERVAAARKLGSAGSRVATEHLIAALFDSAPEVRRAAVEGLGQLGDPAAIAPLNDLLARETSRQLPESAIRHSIHAIAFVEQAVEPRATSSRRARVTEPNPQDRVVESGPAIEAPVVEAAETEARPPPPPPVSLVHESQVGEEARLLLVEDALGKAIEAIEALELRELEADGSRKADKAQARLKAEEEAAAKSNAGDHQLAAEEASLRAEQQARCNAEEVARLQFEQETRAKAEEETRHRAKEEARFRVEAETLRRAAEELARKRAMAAGARKQAEETERKRTAAQARQRAEEKASSHIEEELRKRAEEAVRQRAEEEAFKREDREARRRAAEEQSRQRADEEAHLLAEQEALHLVTEEQLRLAAENKRRAEEQRLRAEQEALRMAAEEVERQRVMVEAASRKAEEEALQLIADHARLQRQEDARRRAGEERLQLEAQVRQRAEAERQRLERTHRGAEEERLRLEQEARLHAEEEEQQLAELEAVRKSVEEQSRQRGEKEQRIRAEIEALLQAEAEQHQRIEEAENRRRIETEERHQEAEQARLKAGEGALRLAEEEARLQAEEEDRHLAELEAIKQRAQAEARERADKEQQVRAEIEVLREAELEQRQKIEEVEARRQEQAERLSREAEALHQTALELERRRVEIEATRNRAEEETKLLIQEQERLRAEQEARLAVEAERRHLEAEGRRRAEEDENARLLESRRRTEEEARKIEEEARRHAQDEERHLAELEVVRRKAEEDSRARAEKERRIRTEIEELKRAEEEQRRRLDAEVRLRAETEARLQQEVERYQAEEQARLRAIEESRRLTEEAARRHSEAERERLEQESRLKNEEEAHHRVTEGYRRLEEESRNQATPLQTAEDVPHVAGEADAQPEYLLEVVTEPKSPWIEVDLKREKPVPRFLPPPVEQFPEQPFAPPVLERESEVLKTGKGIAPGEDSGSVPSDTLSQLNSTRPAERSAALHELAERGGDDSFNLITASFDDPSPDVRNAAAHALHDLESDRAASFTRALREASSERRRRIGTAIAESGLATEAVNHLTGESRERTYDAFSLLFLMAKAGEVQPLMLAIEEHQSTEVRLAVIKLLALSGQPEIVPAFRRLAVRGSLPSEVRSAVMEAIYQISSQARESVPSVA